MNWFLLLRGPHGRNKPPGPPAAGKIPNIELESPNAPLKQLVERCWDADYNKRPNFDEICDILEAQASKLAGRGAASTIRAAGDKPGGDHSGTGCCSVM